MSAAPNPALDWPIDYDAVLLIAESEGCKLKSYLCPAGVWTIGWGHTQNVRPGMTCTQDEADLWLLEDVEDAARAVDFYATADVNANELGAMVSLTFNIGINAFKTSTVLKQHNRGNKLAASRAFGLWNKITDPRTKKKVESVGLTSRRAKEAALYLEPVFDEIEHLPPTAAGVPQRVLGESAMTSSPIAQTGAVSVAGGLVATVSAFVQPIRDFADTMGVDPVVVLGGLAVAVGVIVLVQRLRQRREGWA